MDESRQSLELADIADEPVATTEVGIVEQAPPKLPEALAEALSGYRVIRKISEHPGSIVFKAEDQDANKLVIVKVVDGDVTRASDAFVARKLEIERIKHMRHPCVASVVDIGTTTDGQCFFVSEAIRGQAMLEFAKTHRLSVENRIRLFLKICGALERLHQQCIVHRDLRPSNILIGARGEPRLTGIGVAAVTDFDLGFPAGQVSNREARIFYAYRSPEQIRGVGLDVDVRSDVFVLGELLYELLTGKPPFDVEVEGNSEIFRIVSECEPGSVEVESSKWPRGVKAIILKAIEKAPERRYQSVSAMMCDLQLALGERPSPVSVAGKSCGLVRRLVGAVAAVILVAATFLGGAVFAPSVRDRLPAAIRTHIPQLNTPPKPVVAPPPKVIDASKELKKRVAELEAAQTEAGEQRERAMRQKEAEHKRRLAIEEENSRLARTLGKLQSEIGDLSEKVTAAGQRVSQSAEVTNFLMGMFQASQLDGLSLRSPSALDLLDYAEDAAKDRFSRDPISLATVLSHIGAAYGGLGAYGKGVELIQHALDIRRKELGDNHADTISSMNDLAAMLYNEGKLAEGEGVSQKLVEISDKAFGKDDERTLTAVNNLALVEYGLGKLDAAEKHFRRAMQGRKASFGELDDRTATSTYQLAIVLFERGKLAKAEPYFRKAIKAFDKSLPGSHALPATARSYLGGILVSLGRFDEAEPILLESYGRLASSLGPDHPTSRNTIERIISMYSLWNKTAEAEKWRSKIGRVSVNGPES